MERKTEECVVMSGWTPKDRKTETQVDSDDIRKDMKEKQVKIEEAHDRRTWG